MEEITPAYGVGPLLAIAAGAVALLLLLIIKFRVHALIALVLVSVLTAVATRIPLDELVDTLMGGFGTTLAEVGLLVGLGWGILRGVGAVMHGPPADDAAHPPRGGSGRIDG